jgi:hypothetical protein
MILSRSNFEGYDLKSPSSRKLRVFRSRREEKRKSQRRLGLWKQNVAIVMSEREGAERTRVKGIKIVYHHVHYWMSRKIFSACTHQAVF